MSEKEFDLGAIEILYERYRESESDFKVCREDFLAAVERAIEWGVPLNRIATRVGISAGALNTTLVRRRKR